MENRYEKGHSDQQYPVSLYFSRELKVAIDGGDPEAIVAAVRDLEPNNVTEGISNYLLAHSFLLGEKVQLSRLYALIEDAQSLFETTSSLDAYTASLEDRFRNGFEATEEDLLAKLRGDAVFRWTLCAPNDKLPAIAGYIANLKISSLDTPEATYRRVNTLCHIIGTELATTADYLWGRGFSKEAIRVAKNTVISQVDIIDKDIITQASRPTSL